MLGSFRTEWLVTQGFDHINYDVTFIQGLSCTLGDYTLKHLPPTPHTHTTIPHPRPLTHARRRGKPYIPSLVGMTRAIASMVWEWCLPAMQQRV
jgi:hypothetical protein